ncbi:MAG TPA: DUF72 domain-containing protein [Polyangiaceae bacterium]|nr:DUF72 domain-containing protein [Polyangiaceae bacterium]
MARVHVGPRYSKGDIGKLSTKFDLLELPLTAGAIPKPATLRSWRRAVGPGFAFSVVLPRSVSDLEMTKAMDAELDQALEVARVIEARCVLLSTSANVRPTAANIAKLARVVERLPKPSVALAWEPHGIWERADVARVAKQLGLLPVVDAAQEPLFPGSLVYTRLRSLGASRDVSARALARLAEQLKGRREVWVVVEHPPSAARVRAELTRETDQLPAQDGPIVVRPTPGRLRAEDEEQ